MSFIIQDINRTHFRVCIEDYAGIDGQRDIMWLLEVNSATETFEELCLVFSLGGEHYFDQYDCKDSTRSSLLKT